MDTKNIDIQENLMTVDELAAFLKVPRSWLYSRSRVAPDNGFPIVKVGKYLRFRKDEVLRWLSMDSASK
jgi:excisionase family DNA binding protein